MKPNWIILVLAAANFSSCNHSTEFSGPNPFPPSSQINFPLEGGGVWNYDASTTTFNFRPIVAGTTFRDTVIRWTSHVQSLGRDTLRDSIEVWRFHTSETAPGVSSADNFYIARNDTLFLYAYAGAALVLPKQPSPYRFTYGERSFNSLESLLNALRAKLDFPSISGVNDTFFEAKPPKVLVFPLRRGLEWTYREKGNPFHIGRVVTGDTLILNTAGFFTAFKIQWMWDLQNRDVWDSAWVGYDLLGSRGLIRRYFLLKDLVIIGPDGPDPIGYFDVKMEYTLTSTNL